MEKQKQRKIKMNTNDLAVNMLKKGKNKKGDELGVIVELNEAIVKLNEATELIKEIIDTHMIKQKKELERKI